MPISLLQTVATSYSDDAGGTHSITGTWTQSTANGSFLVCTLSHSGSPTVTVPSGWTKLINGVAHGAFTCGMYYYENAPVQTTVQTQTWSWTIPTPVVSTLIMAEYSGVDIVSPSDGLATSIGTGATITSGLLTVASTSDLLLYCATQGVQSIDSTGFSNPTGGFTIINQISDFASPSPRATSGQALSSTTATTNGNFLVTITAVSSIGWATIFAGFKAFNGTDNGAAALTAKTMFNVSAIDSTSIPQLTAKTTFSAIGEVVDLVDVSLSAKTTFSSAAKINYELAEQLAAESFISAVNAYTIVLANVSLTASTTFLVINKQSFSAVLPARSNLFAQEAITHYPSAKDIVLLLSGGAANQLPSLSLGGAPSNTKLVQSVNNLFSPLNSNTIPGNDYRCIYVLNNHPMASFMDVLVWMTDLNNGIAALGVVQADEIQQIILTGTTLGGTFALQYTFVSGQDELQETTAAIQWVPQLDLMSDNIANALNSLSLLNGVEVTATNPTSNEYIYTIEFGGIDGNRQQETLAVVNNNLIGNPQFQITRVRSGSPINNITTFIGFANQPPTNISFISPFTALDAIPIGTLSPGDFFPLWIQRTISQENLTLLSQATSDIPDDGLGLHVVGQIVIFSG